MRNTGLPHYRSDIEQELLTPTGASVLAGVVDRFLENDAFERAWKDAAEQGLIGRGTGKRDTGLPPMAVMLAETK